MDGTKALRANGISMPLHKTPKPTWPRVLICSIACLPDERHITRDRSDSAIMDTDRARAGHLDVDGAGEGDGYDVGSRCATVSLGDGRRGPVVRFQADPFDAGAGNM